MTATTSTTTTSTTASPSAASAPTPMVATVTFSNTFAPPQNNIVGASSGTVTIQVRFIGAAAQASVAVAAGYEELVVYVVTAGGNGDTGVQGDKYTPTPLAQLTEVLYASNLLSPSPTASLPALTGSSLVYVAVDVKGAMAMISALDLRTLVTDYINQARAGSGGGGGGGTGPITSRP